MKPLVCDLPYPTDHLTNDVASAKILAFAYATPTGELTSVLQYFMHSTVMRKFSSEDAEILFAIALAEMKHLQILGQCMFDMGLTPKFVQIPHSKRFFDTSTVAQSVTPKEMLTDDLKCELDAVAQYKKMLFVLKNAQLAAVVRRIVLDEQLHIDALQKMSEKYK